MNGTQFPYRQKRERESVHILKWLCYVLMNRYLCGFLSENENAVSIHYDTQIQLRNNKSRMYVYWQVLFIVRVFSVDYVIK